MSDSVERDELITRVQKGELTPEEADAEVRRLKLPPLIQNPDPYDFAPEIELDWSLPMAVAWVAYRRMNAVREWWSAYRDACRDWIPRRWRIGSDGPVYEGYFLEPRPKATLASLRSFEAIEDTLGSDIEMEMSVSEATNSLGVALQIGQFFATGVDPKVSERVRFPAEAWQDIEFVSDGDRDLVRSKPVTRGSSYLFENVTVPSGAMMQLWLSKADRALPTLPPLMAPNGAGLMPLFLAAQWIATEGGAVDVDPKDVRNWERSYRKLLDHVASGQVRISGVRDRLRQPIDGTIFADCPIDYPYQNTSFEMMMSEEYILLSHNYVDEETWRSGFDDRIENRDGKLWTRVMVDKVDIARIWPFGLQDNQAVDDELLPSGAPGRPTVMHIVVAEFEKRRAAGELEDRVVEQACVLAQWLRDTHPGAKPLSPKTIENNIRAEFRRAKAPRK